MSRVVLDEKAIAKALEIMADSIVARSGDGPWAVVGIRRGGEPLARRLAALLGKRTEIEPALGMVDITLYRDDGFGPSEWPVVGITDIPFVLKEHTVVLVDDVLYTGRTVRAAIDAILDYGRPRAVRLAVLVDRGLRELPIRADVVGTEFETQANERVEVRLTETGADVDAVVLLSGAEKGGESG